MTTLAAFGHDTWWLVLGKALAIFVFLMLNVLVAILLERKMLGWMQLRPGPNRVGPWGTLQSLADGIKLALKESITPGGVDKFVYFAAPVISAIPAFTAFAFIPFGPVVSVFGHRTPLQLTDLPVAVLFILGLSAIGVYGIVLGGWASGSTYPLLGGVRSTAQVISYEVAMGAVVRGGLPLRRHHVDVGDRGGAGPRLVRVPATAVVRDLPHLDGRRNQQGAIRFARGRGRTGRADSTPSTRR